MEENINIADILKDKPQGTKLYADAFGELKLERVSTSAICTRTKEGTLYTFYNNGKYDKNGEPILVPSKEMRDWRKFAWKKGDVLVSNDYGTEVIFYDWYDDTYTNFYGKHYLNSEDKNNIKYNDAFLCTTGRYSLEDKDAAQTYINTIEERLGGKLNRETLEIEKQSYFKDGDILHSDETEYSDETIFIAKISGRVMGTYAYIDLLDKSVMMQNDPFKKSEINAIRLATDSEKQQLFDALAEEGKAWDAENKQVVDLKIKWTPKPFDKVMTRVDRNAIWSANIFSHIDQNGEYVTIGCIAGYPYCLPYNDDTAHLIGTTDEWKGGEG